VTDYIDARYEFTEELIWLAAQPVPFLGEARLNRKAVTTSPETATSE
jgi:hypothetical protein